LDTKKLIETLTKNPAASAAMGGLAGSLLGNVLTGRGGGGGKKLVKYGGLAAVGYVAYQAWQKNQAQKAGGVAPMPGAGGVAGGTAGASAGGLAGMLQSVLGGQGGPAPALPAPFDLEAPANAGNALHVVRAMIAASKADGQVDADERDRIYTRINEAGLSAADRAQVEQLLAQPADVDAVVRGVNSRELATEIYAASLIACAPASRAERAYLDMLAARLNLEPGLTMELDRSVEVLQKSP
jgi:uncharacterized membrane protein YebE (DUF533 family)